MRINLMVEGQEDVTWSQWTALGTAVEDAGLEGLFRSDHYQSLQGEPDRGSLDAWAILSALGAVTERIRLGTMVSPASFRHPSVLARSVVTADHVSGGRVELGMGAGWNEPEHNAHGFDFHEVGTRFGVLVEQVEIVVRQMTEERFDFQGEHYTLTECRAQPKPVQSPRVPLILGGLAGPRAAALAARWADEYNTVFPTPEQAAERRASIERACERAGREPLGFSVMTACLLGETEDEVRDRARRQMELSGREGDVDEWMAALDERAVIGTVEQAAERLERYARAGVERIMLQQLLHDDVEMVALMGRLT